MSGYCDVKYGLYVVCMYRRANGLRGESDGTLWVEHGAHTCIVCVHAAGRTQLSSSDGECAQIELLVSAAIVEQ